MNTGSAKVYRTSCHQDPCVDRRCHVSHLAAKQSANARSNSGFGTITSTQGDPRIAQFR